MWQGGLHRKGSQGQKGKLKNTFWNQVTNFIALEISPTLVLVNMPLAPLPLLVCLTCLPGRVKFMALDVPRA